MLIHYCSVIQGVVSFSCTGGSVSPVLRVPTGFLIQHQIGAYPVQPEVSLFYGKATKEDGEVGDHIPEPEVVVH